MERWILHVDMDEFFAAVEKLDRPELAGRCLLIGGSAEGRGVVSTASYEARVFGCHSAMPMAQAMRLCPHAIVLPVRGRRYQEVSEQVFEIFHRYTPLVEPLSCDEAFLDVTGSRRLHGPAEAIAARIRQDVREQVGITCSVGVATNKFLAKLASDLDKPDGLTVIAPPDVQRVLDKLPLRRIWGIGPAACRQFERLNIQTIGQLRRAEAGLLTRRFGSAAAHWMALARGEDDRPVTPDHQARSIGQEQTFAVDVGELDALRGVLLEQTEEVARRLRRSGMLARTVTLKLRYGDFTTITRSRTLSGPADGTEVLWRAASGLLEAWAGGQFAPLRLLGVQVTQLERAAGRQLGLFEAPPEQQKLRRLDATLDEIAARFGRDAVRRAGGGGPRRG